MAGHIPGFPQFDPSAILTDIQERLGITDPVTTEAEAEIAPTPSTSPAVETSATPDAFAADSPPAAPPPTPAATRTYSRFGSAQGYTGVQSNPGSVSTAQKFDNSSTEKSFSTIFSPEYMQSLFGEDTISMGLLRTDAQLFGEFLDQVEVDFGEATSNILSVLIQEGCDEGSEIIELGKKLDQVYASVTEGLPFTKKSSTKPEDKVKQIFASLQEKLPAYPYDDNVNPDDNTFVSTGLDRFLNSETIIGNCNVHTYLFAYMFQRAGVETNHKIGISQDTAHVWTSFKTSKGTWQDVENTALSFMTESDQTQYETTGQLTEEPVNQISQRAHIILDNHQEEQYDALREELLTAIRMFPSDFTNYTALMMVTERIVDKIKSDAEQLWFYETGAKELADEQIKQLYNEELKFFLCGLPSNPNNQRFTQLILPLARKVDHLNDNLTGTKDALITMSKNSTPAEFIKTLGQSVRYQDWGNHVEYTPNDRFKLCKSVYDAAMELPLTEMSPAHWQALYEQLDLQAGGITYYWPEVRTDLDALKAKMSTLDGTVASRTTTSTEEAV